MNIASPFRFQCRRWTSRAWRRTTWTITLAATCAACAASTTRAASEASSAPAAAAQPVVVFAAASLRNALDELDRGWQAQHHAAVVVSYAASSALARQIDNGAPADVFIAADEDWMNHLDRRGLLKPGTRVDLLRNAIVLIAPASSTASLTIAPGFPLAQALGAERLAMADPEHVPAGRYGKAALQSLGVWQAVAGHIARAEDVRAALNFVARGEAPFGIVYRTDARAEPRVRIVGTFPPGSHPAIVYPAALLREGRSAAAPAFLAFLRTAQASEIFRKHGFVPY
jgi:molybdate transport system substrate-binding protein